MVRSRTVGLQGTLSQEITANQPTRQKKEKPEEILQIPVFPQELLEKRLAGRNNGFQVTENTLHDNVMMGLCIYALFHTQQIYDTELNSNVNYG